MASPKLEVLFFYDASTGAPLTGLAPYFITYKNDQGTNVSQPTISEIGGGAYKFTPVFSDPARGIVYVAIAGGSSAVPSGSARYMRPEDWNDDNSDIPTSSVTGSLGSLTGSITTFSASLATDITLIKGLLGDNSVLDSIVLDGNKNLTSARLRLFPTRADTLAGTNAIKAYSITATVNGADPATLTQVSSSA